ncbi:CheR family methyltransferase [Saccharicrinis fermentans]|uniref:CheR methyltransferase n=1 Tax=Saccharicrinis fermentans DSM 9555 = JCM 21142 TaxID=869213 RepID=W7Y2P2_9BACT|nr:CheR family methyltransferase [Saccharicrinis fermentans]GAF01838.1 CheR methyltransferase [Saccharicrinis fermentans DSM 9555 = JCM 21142]
MAIGPTINDIREITSVLSEKLKMDYSNYAFSFLRRRFAFLFEELKVKNTRCFLEALDSNDLMDEFCYLFPVEEKEMFRDPSFWRTLRGKIIPEIQKENLSFWFPELVSTEELLSLIVILDEQNLLQKSTIYCNVGSSKRVEVIMEGRIHGKFTELNKSNFKRLELACTFEKYFVEETGYIRMASDKWLDHVVFLSGNYFNHLPDKEVDVTFFRNRMLYYNAKLQAEAERQLHRSLNKGAFVVLGIKEKILKENELNFVLYDRGEQIYRIS